jgi:hypothetical protein
MSLNRSDLYRFPWSKNDNPIAWLEVTDVCNLRCEGCYRKRLTGHKPLEEIKEEILLFKQWRNPDSVSIAGGEPLVHPEILDIVAFVAENGLKPILLTNAIKLSPELLRELKRAGLSGFTVHIDSRQGRPGWEDKSEAELNELRQYYADMLDDAGGLITVFNSTVYPSTLHQVPDVVRWGRTAVGKVHGLVFITYRRLDTDTGVGVDISGRQVDASELSYSIEGIDEQVVTGRDICQIIKDNFPEYAPSGYLGGTMRHDSFKWLIGAMLVSKYDWYGSLGKRTMELVQVGHHVFCGTYVAYLSDMGMLPVLFLMSPWDRTVRQAAKRWLRDLLRHPWRLFEGVRTQTISIIQAPDLQPNGQADMCDSCPDMTVWNGTLVNSCRMDEYRLFGSMLSVAEKPEEVTEPEPLVAELQLSLESEPAYPVAGGAT